MKQKITISGGLYLVLDPSMPLEILIKKLTEALDGGVNVLQVWNNWPNNFNMTSKIELVNAITAIASAYNVPILVNEEWELLKHTSLSGVHFDHIPNHYENIKTTINRDFIAGITCSNDLSTVKWAVQQQLDYISFCALFPSKSAGVCEIVAPETIQKAREITHLPFFVSGGITAQNLSTLKDLDFTGVAVISGILSVDNPRKAASAYVQAINQLKK